MVEWTRRVVRGGGESGSEGEVDQVRAGEVRIRRRDGGEGEAAERDSRDAFWTDRALESVVGGDVAVGLQRAHALE